MPRSNSWLLVYLVHRRADCEVDMFVKLCEEDIEDESDRGRCGKLVKAMHGTHPAAQAWQREYTRRLTDAGLTVGDSSPCIFHHRGRDVCVFVHGDDFVASGAPQDVSWFRELLSSFYQIKATALGEANGCQTCARVLEQILRWNGGVGISYEADPGTRWPSSRLLELRAIAELQRRGSTLEGIILRVNRKKVSRENSLVECCMPKVRLMVRRCRRNL